MAENTLYFGDNLKIFGDHIRHKDEGLPNCGMRNADCEFEFAPPPQLNRSA